MIVYSEQTTTLIPILHGLSGVVRTGESQGVRNYMTVLWLHGQKEASDLDLVNAIDHIHQFANRPNVYVPVVYRFQIGRNRWQRDLAAIHGVVDVKRGLTWQQEFRFVVVFDYEVAEVLKKTFKAKGSITA